MELHLKIIGALLMGLALAHVVFPWYFNWKEDLAHLSLINRQMMKVHTLFIAVGVLLMGALCLFEAEELVTSRLGKVICLGFAIFWGLRLFVQFFGYSSELWQGKRFETTVHWVFSLLWLYLTVVFGWVYLGG